MATNANTRVTPQAAASDLDRRPMVLEKSALTSCRRGRADRRHPGPQQWRQRPEPIHTRSIADSFAGRVEIEDAQQTYESVESLQMPMARWAAKRFIDLGHRLPLAVFFTRRRIGRGSREMTMVNLRSRPNHTSAVASTCQSRGADSTRFGGFIGKTHPREFPQLGLAERRSMSLVGYRPGLPKSKSPSTAQHRSAREVFAPGCIGLWQLSNHGSGLRLEHSEYDHSYVRYQSAALDLWLLAQTSLVRLRGAKPSIGTLPALLVSEDSTGSYQTAELFPVDPPRSM